MKASPLHSTDWLTQLCHKPCYGQLGLSCLYIESSVKAQQLLGQFIGGEGHGHHGDGTHVVDTHASIQALCDAILPVD